MWPFSKPKPKSSTGVVLSAAELRAFFPGAICGDSTYAEVNSAWLKSYYDEFRSALFDAGVVKWDEKFDCNHFASFYVALAQAKFFAENFQSWTRAQTLAIGCYWYRIGGAAASGHAIVAAKTERGVVFIEPQTGQEVTLTEAEKSSAFLKLF